MKLMESIEARLPEIQSASPARAETAIVPVIMCGGAGTRLWPASRESMPKQFIPFFDGLSSFQTTAKRLAAPGFGRIIVLASNEVRFIVAEQLQSLGITAEVVLEPVRRDSAAAVAAATCMARRRDPEAIVAVVAADHLVDDAAAFAEACRAAALGARAGFIMTLGVRPTSPATGYGYIRPGAPIPDTDAQRVERFVEKPDHAAAVGYVAQDYLWNSGNFLFRADVMVEELRRFVPQVLSAAEAAVEHATIDVDFVRLSAEGFGRAPRTSIDYAVMERTARAGVLPVSFSWSDIGTWGTLWSSSARDGCGNVLTGDVAIVDTRDSLVHSPEILTTVVGLQGIVVVATPDAILVTSRERSDAVKDLVAHLKARQRPEVDEHRRMYRPWGWYQRMDIGPRFQVKRIVVKPGHRLSLQKHFHRAEHWVVVRGTAEVTVDDKTFLRHENEAAYLPIGCIHRLTNPGRIPLELIEVQVGSYTNEDDIVRFEDNYGR